MSKSEQVEFTPEEFGNLMAELPAGVAILTLKGANGPMGLAVTSFTAYTAEPPSVMTSVAHSSRSHDPLLECASFGAHLLHNEQEHIAKAFASKSDDKFAELDWEWDGDVPHIKDTLAYIRCKPDANFKHLDHTVLIGVIEHAEHDNGLEAMVYLKRNFSWRMADASDSEIPTDDED